MADKPILFNSEMVRAILDGRKTQTRRVIKPQPENLRGYTSCGVIDGELVFRTLLGYSNNTETLRWKCPYGVAGDRLWVREMWQAGIEWDDEKPSQVDPLCGGYDVNYTADGKKTAEVGYGKIRPSIFMPKWAARLWLEITGIRVEKVQEISEEDAIAEGLSPEGTDLRNGFCADNPYEQFAQLWDSINAKRGYSWESNPWVWVVEFRKVKDV